MAKKKKKRAPAGTAAGGIMGVIWERAFANTVAAELGDVMKIVVDKFRECMNRGEGGAAACLAKVADDLKLGTKIADVYAKHKFELRSMTGPAWQLFLSGIRKSLSNAVRGIISDAYRDCIHKTGEAAADCYRRIAEEKKLGEELSKAWAAYEVRIPDEVLAHVLERASGLA